MKILIVKMSSLGDVIHTLPLVKILKDKLNSSVTIDWVLNEEYVHLIENNGIVRKAIPFKRREWLSPLGFLKAFKEIRCFASMLKDEEYDLVLDLQGLLKSALVVSMAGGKHNVGFSDAREGATLFYHTKIMVEKTMHAVEKNLLFLDFFKLKYSREEIAFPIPVTAEDKDFIENLLKSLDINGDFVIFCPFSRWKTKIWKEQNFHHLAKILKEKGLTVLWTGSKTEHLEKTPQYDLTGMLTLNQLYYLMKKSCFVVTCDSGAMHLATASGTDIVAIFGPTSPLKTGPYQTKNNAVVIQRTDLSCVPCFRKTCDIGNVCLDISADDVFKTIEKEILQ